VKVKNKLQMAHNSSQNSIPPFSNELTRLFHVLSWKLSCRRSFKKTCLHKHY